MPEQPLPYLASPLALFVSDVFLFLQLTLFSWPPIRGLPSIVWPIWPFRSGKLDELYPSPANLWSLALQLLMSVAQIVLFLSVIPFAFFGIPVPFYTALYLTSIVFFVLGNRWLSILLNGRRKKRVSKINLDAWPKHDDEYWIFINGVAAGEHWLQSNLDRLALAFRRPIHAIQNQTRGIIFDVIECIIQRALLYATHDIRIAYSRIVSALANPSLYKVVLILHSQGALEGGVALDWLYATVPQDQLEKLEVYTFGNAANHWNSPLKACAASGQSGKRGTPGEERVVRHIEHYANTWDWVSRFGILNFRPVMTEKKNWEKEGRGATFENNRFVGRLFCRDATGHQMNGNYLDNMFEMDPELTRVLDSNDFMDAVVDLDAFEMSDTVSAMPQGKGQRDDNNEESMVRVKDLSRLWKYRNGQSPDD